MDPTQYSTKNGGLSLHELISLIEEDNENQYDNLDVYITPPDENSAETEEDSDASDDEHVGNVNHLSSGILQQSCEIRTKDNDDFEGEDLIPLAQLLRKEKPLWSENVPEYKITRVCEEPREPSASAKLAENPVDFFQLLFDDELLSEIVNQTNIYGLQKNNNLRFVKDELYVILGGLLLSGYAKYPNKRMFWNTTEDIPLILKNSMRLNRFENLLRHIHFNNNSQINSADKLYKIRLIIDHLNKKFKEHGGLEEHLLIDESMILYYGKHYAKQYIKGKPIRFGFKNWVICTSFGYMISFDIYTGKSNMQKEFGLGGDVVISLLKKAEVTPNKGYKIYFDNYFTSLKLLAHLSSNQICASGTIRENRTERCPFPASNTWKGKPRGSYKFVANEDVIFVQWMDNKIVSMGSNYENDDIVSASRWCKDTKSRRNVPQPKIIAKYNQGMGGVDKMDGLIALYRSRMRQRKWHWPIFAYLLDASVVNAWLLMKKLKPDNIHCSSLLSFRRYIAVSFLQTYGTKPTRGKTSLPHPVASQYDNIGHMIEYSPTDRRCKVCGKKSNFVCQKCDCGLHPKVGFLEYHTK